MGHRPGLLWKAGQRDRDGRACTGMAALPTSTAAQVGPIALAIVQGPANACLSLYERPSSARQLVWGGRISFGGRFFGASPRFLV
mgnify:FL=1